MCSQEHRRCPFLMVTTWLIVVGLVGCGGESKEGLDRAYGYVTLDGEPLVDSLVSFDHPNEAETFGRTDSSGYYDMYFTRDQRGAFTGENVVSFTTFDPDLKTEERVPRQYLHKWSQLTVEITDGGSPYNFDLVTELPPDFSPKARR